VKIIFICVLLASLCHVNAIIILYRVYRWHARFENRLCKGTGRGINNVKKTWYIEMEGKTSIKRQIIEPHKCQPCKYYIRLIDVHRYKYQTDAFRSSMLPKHK